MGKATSVREPPEFERLLAELSARFVNLPAAEVDAAITSALQRIVVLLGVDRSQLVRIGADDGDALITHSWAVEGVPVVAPRPISDNYPWVIARLRAGKAAVVPRLDALPPEADVDRASFQGAGVRSNLTVPLRVGGRIEGAIAFGCLRHEVDWPKALVERIGGLADVFANALAHKRAREALERAIAFERVVSDILAGLLTAGRAEYDRVIESGLHELAGVLGAQRATLWRRVEGRDEFAKTHRWLADGVRAAAESAAAVAIPWISAQVVAGNVVRFARHADLPLAASVDVATLRELDIRAAVIVPLAVSGAVVGALSLASRDDREWPDELLPRVKIVGEVFASVLSRQAAERREQEAQAQAAHAARVGTMGVLAASLVHELTQPLAASLANAETAAELLAQDLPDIEELRATVSDIVADERRVGDLIQQLRRFLRRGDVERRELDLREVVAEVVRLVADDAAARNIAVGVDIPDALPRLVADRVQLAQVLLNLVHNGVDAVAGGASGQRRVDVIARPSAAGARIEVSDTGTGIDEQTLARIFQPFFTTKPSGMGLGLSISRSIVTAHGGSLTVSSEPGRGTTFRIELPAGRALDARESMRESIANGAGGTVFVIDDDPSMRRALERQLHGTGYRVVSFASAHDYLERPPEPGIACIVSDVRMPGLSGLDLQASLARQNRDDLPIVFVSGHGDVPTTVQALKSGAVNFLAKPFTKDALLMAVGEALARSRDIDRSRRERAQLRARYESLTPREREVFTLVAEGLLNKVIADRLGTAEATVKIHRGRVMEKMGAGSVADLVRIAESLRISGAELGWPCARGALPAAIPPETGANAPDV